MDSQRLIRVALLASTVCCAMALPGGRPLAATFQEFVDPNPAPENGFGTTVVALSTGNVVITSPLDDFGGLNARGAVYLFNGATGALISTLRGSAANDQVGSGGVTALTNGNYVVSSGSWNASRGAATWGSGTSGVNGVVSVANSLVGSTAFDQIGFFGVTALANGNYVVVSHLWNNGAVADAGAVTWGNGTSGRSGVVSAANSLVGSTANDQVGLSGVTALSNGNYVVPSANWDNGGVVNAGAATWGNGASGVTGVVSAANSLVGSTASDNIGGNVTALTNGSYVVASPNWDNGAVGDAGAATWGSGTTGVTGAVSAANSLVGSTAGDNISSVGVTALSNGNYVVASPNWNNGAVVDVGAATWGSGTSGVSGVVSAANSLVGPTAGDNISSGGVTALSNGNYVVLGQNFNNGAVIDAGAATWASGTTGATGLVSAANSLVGSTGGNQVGNGATALTNGNYVVRSPFWDGAAANVGAATWGSGTSGVTGVVTAANSLVGSTVNDNVGDGGVTALANGNYVVRSRVWDNGALASAGAATWGSGTTGVSGAVSAANSLIGSTANDQVGSDGVTALANGNYVVASGTWVNGALANAGAATWGSGMIGVSGVISAANSLVGSTAGDQVGDANSGGGVTALANGNYVVVSTSWNNGAVVDAGAVTWGSGTTGVSGVVSATNSLVGSTASDRLGNPGLTALANGNYVVLSELWDNGAVANAGAATWGSGTTGVIGTISFANSLVGTTASATGATLRVVANNVNDTFVAASVAEGGGRARVGPLFVDPVTVSAVDIPNDQGGWLRLTFGRSELDVTTGSPPIATYGVWRHVPGTVPAGASAPLGARPDAAVTQRMRAALPPGLDVQVVDGRLYVSGRGSPGAGVAAAFPPGTWALVASVPAVQQAQYVVEVPTISDAAPNDFVVTAHTTTPSIWFISDPVSGQSLDTMAPATPTLFTGAYSGGQTSLQWTPNTEFDLGYYRLYRGTSADFTPGPGNLIATVVLTSHVDVGPAGRHYKLSAVDASANESGYAHIGPDETTDVEGEDAVAFALEGPQPNPARGRGLHVVFALPNGAAARLELLDVTGRRVLVREVGSLGKGRHTVNLAEGRRVASGIYWVMLTQGANEQTTRVAVIE